MLLILNVVSEEWSNSDSVGFCAIDDNEICQSYFEDVVVVDSSNKVERSVQLHKLHHRVFEILQRTLYMEVVNATSPMTVSQMVFSVQPINTDLTEKY